MFLSSLYNILPLWLPYSDDSLIESKALVRNSKTLLVCEVSSCCGYCVPTHMCVFGCGSQECYCVWSKTLSGVKPQHTEYVHPPLGYCLLFVMNMYTKNASIFVSLRSTRTDCYCGLRVFSTFCLVQSFFTHQSILLLCSS